MKRTTKMTMEVDVQNGYICDFCKKETISINLPMLWVRVERSNQNDDDHHFCSAQCYMRFGYNFIKSKHIYGFNPDKTFDYKSISFFVDAMMPQPDFLNLSRKYLDRKLDKKTANEVYNRMCSIYMKVHELLDDENETVH